MLIGPKALDRFILICVAKLWRNYQIRRGYIGCSAASSSSVSSWDWNDEVLSGTKISDLWGIQSSPPRL